MKLKMGSRTSLLARAQSLAAVKNLKSLHPSLEVEFVGIETKGDQIQDIPLWKTEGKDFFVAELDQALLEKRVDFTVHSLKDLSLTRPSEFVTAAIPKRSDPRDWVIFSLEIESRLKSGEAIRVGTSSPRRLENIPPFLKKALPVLNGVLNGKSPEIQMVEIRGNVDTRLKRLNLPPSDPKSLDGVVLAGAGLLRLMEDEEGRAKISDFLNINKKMILPLSLNPTAPGQGALAIECLKENKDALEILKSLHDPETEKAVRSERALFSSFGGGCHQRFGVSEIHHPEVGQIRFSKGVKPDGSVIDEKNWQIPPPPKGKVSPWESSHLRNQVFQEMKLPWKSPSQDTFFISHSRALPDEALSELKTKTLYASGVSTWFSLALRGIWVTGSAEGLGEEWFFHSLPEKKSWVTLTHEGAPPSKTGAQNLATYSLEARADLKCDLKKYTHFYWASASMYLALERFVPKNAHHASGPGKTAEILRDMGLGSVEVFLSKEEWEKWLKN